jgi:outer membrane protein assembly factor BamB
MKKYYFLFAILLSIRFTAFAQPAVEVKWGISCGTGTTEANSPALSVSGDTVYFVNGTAGKLYAFNASDGTEVWNFTLNVAKSNPARTNVSVGNDGTVYVPVGSNDNNPAYLYAVNSNGTEKWKYEIGSGANIAYIAPAITKDGDILVGNTGANGALHWVDKENGTKKAYVKPQGGVLGAIVASLDNVAYVQSGNNGFNAYNLNEINDELVPAHLGTYKPVEDNFYSAGSPAIGKDGNFLAAGGTGRIVSLHIDNTLSNNWVYPSGTNLSKIEQSGVAIGADGTLYVAGSENKKIYALNPGGTLKWEFATDGNAQSVPAVDNKGYIHFGDDSGKYYILEDKTTGAEQLYKATLSNSSATATRIWSSPAIAGDGSIYFAVNTSSGVFLFKIAVSGVTGPANSYWPMRGGNAQRTGLEAWHSIDFIVNSTCPANDYTLNYGNIIFEADGQLTGIGSEGLTVNGLVKYRNTFTPKQWYAVGFPFAPASYWGDFTENADLYIWNGTYGDFWVKDYDGNTFNDSQTMEAGKGYIIQFPNDFNDAEVVFTSETGVSLKNITENDLDAALALAESNHYYLVANPSANNLTLSTANKYYIYNGIDNFNLLASGTVTVKPFESFVVANGVAQNSLRSSLSVDNVTALEPLHLNDPVVGTEYYNLQGQKVQYPVRNNLYIVKKTHSSGKTDTVKIIK